MAGNTVAFGPAAWTGLFPGSLGRVPVAMRRHQQFSSRGQGKGGRGENALCSSIALVMRQFFP